MFHNAKNRLIPAFWGWYKRSNTICLILSCFIKRKDNKHFKIVECSSTYLGCKIVLLGCCRVKYSTLIYRSDGGKVLGLSPRTTPPIPFLTSKHYCVRVSENLNYVQSNNHFVIILGNLRNSRISLLTVEQKTRHLLVFQNKALHL